MKTQTTRLALVLVTLSGAIACSSKSDPPATTATDAEVDVAVVDTGKPPTPKPDTGAVETGPITCAQDLPSDFACVAPKKKTGATTCSEAQVQSLISDCFEGDADACDKWVKANAECNKCVEAWLTDGGFVDTAACMLVLKSDGVCAKAVACQRTCIDTVCGECDDTPGSGSTASRSELDDCLRDAEFAGSASKPKGRCYDVASKDAKACRADVAFEACTDLARFFRGACRDGGDWSKSGEAGDAGVPADTGTPADGGSADTAVSDVGAAG